MAYKRVVIKVGTSTLTYENGKLNIGRMESLCKVICDLSNSGMEIILVTSGAVGVGMGKLSIKERPHDIEEKQALAAVGQCELMFMYDKLCGYYNNIVAQVLMTGDIVDRPRSKVHVINTFNMLLKKGIIPIVNENDAVSIDELEGHSFGDNDMLSAIVAGLVHADMLVILTDIDGLYDDNPAKKPNARKLDTVDVIDERIISMAGGSGSNRGTGGMATKLRAALHVTKRDIPCCVMSGAEPERIYDLLKGENVGTMFSAGGKKR